MKKRKKKITLKRQRAGQNKETCTTTTPEGYGKKKGKKGHTEKKKSVQLSRGGCPGGTKKEKVNVVRGLNLFLKKRGKKSM